MTKIPYKINLSEDELPKYWQNIRPYMQEAPDPFINPVTFKPVVNFCRRTQRFFQIIGSGQW